MDYQFIKLFHVKPLRRVTLKLCVSVVTAIVILILFALESRRFESDTNSAGDQLHRGCATYYHQHHHGSLASCTSEASSLHLCFPNTAPSLEFCSSSEVRLGIYVWKDCLPSWARLLPQNHDRSRAPPSTTIRCTCTPTLKPKESSSCQTPLSSAESYTSSSNLSTSAVSTATISSCPSPWRSKSSSSPISEIISHHHRKIRKSIQAWRSSLRTRSPFSPQK